MQHKLASVSLDDLHLFTRVAALGSFSAAARERDVPTSQVSRVIAKIERAQELSLITRSTHGLALTPEGQIFLASCAQLGDTLAQLQAQLDTSAHEVSGVVRLSVSTLYARYVVIEPFAALLAQHPKLQIDLVVSDRMSDLVRDAIDIAVRAGELAQDNLVAKQIGTQRRLLCASPAYAREHGLPQSVSALLEHRLIANNAVPALNRWRLVEEGAVRELNVEGTHRASSTASVLDMVRAGLGISRISSAAAYPMLRRGELLRVLESCDTDEEAPVFAVMRPQVHRLPKVRATLEFLQTLLKPAAL